MYNILYYITCTYNVYISGIERRAIHKFQLELLSCYINIMHLRQVVVGVFEDSLQPAWQADGDGANVKMSKTHHI